MTRHRFRFLCPDCSGVVFHDCKPPSYYAGRRPPSTLPLLQLPNDPDVERPEWARRLFGEEEEE